MFVLGWKEGRVCRAERCGRECGRALARSRRGRYKVFIEMSKIIGAVELRRQLICMQKILHSRFPWK